MCDLCLTHGILFHANALHFDTKFILRFVLLPYPGNPYSTYIHKNIF